MGEGMKIKFIKFNKNKVRDPDCYLCDDLAIGFLSISGFVTPIFVCKNHSLVIKEDNPLLVPFLKAIPFLRW